MTTKQTNGQSSGNSAAKPAGCGCGPSCCSPEGAASTDQAQSVDIREQIRDGYAKIARDGSWSAFQATAPTSEKAGGCCAPSAGGGCCGPATFSPEQLAQAIGYSGAELAGMPEGANMGLSCGNPTAIASLKAGEVVLDLGSGGGFDCFIAGPKVGASGRVIGVDMTPDMITKARRNTAMYRARTGLENVEFRLGEIENLPVADSSIDVVISNCVLNLSPDKARAWREIGRVLRPGGRVAVSDLALLRPLPAAVREDVEALVGCIAGAVLVDEVRSAMRTAGLTDIQLTPKPEYIAAMTNWEDPLYRKIVQSLPAGTTPADYITSLDISARRAV
jgi:arsenite methyltransferase